MVASTRLHFSLGPVQSFIAKARKTRDLWSGSFLLSYLTGCAMNEIENLGGTIELPYIRDNPINQVISKSEDKELDIGSLPNSFIATHDTIDLAKLAKAAEKRIIQEWKGIANKVWEKYVEEVADTGNRTREIWNNQIDSFWEIMWIVGPEGVSLNTLKNWRTYAIPDQDGDKCMMMGDWQEISGFTRSIKRGAQDNFWQNIRIKLPSSELKENERICAIALIKRLFPSIADKVEINIRKTIWPSTSYIAAVPWLKKAAELDENILNSFTDIVVNSNLIENPLRWKKATWISRLSRDRQSDFFGLAADVFYASHYDTNSSDNNALRVLRKIYAKIGQPGKFYGVLAMDGDHLGKLKYETKDPTILSEVLSKYSNSVRKIVEAHLGFLIYAGGDDVLALLPLDTIIRCSVKLATKFSTFMDESLGKNATMSAGIVITSHTDPLGNVMEYAQKLLNEKAKERNGRSSIAVDVLNNANLKTSFVTTWEHIRNNGSNKIDQLIQLARTENFVSKSFIYRSRLLLQRIVDEPVWRPGMYLNLNTKLDLEKLLIAEAVTNREANLKVNEKLSDFIELLADLMRTERRNSQYESLNEGWINTDILNLLSLYTLEENI